MSERLLQIDPSVIETPKQEKFSFDSLIIDLWAQKLKGEISDQDFDREYNGIVESISEEELARLEQITMFRSEKLTGFAKLRRIAELRVRKPMVKHYKEGSIKTAARSLKRKKHY